MILRNSILTGFILALLTQCNNQHNDASDSGIKIDFNPPPPFYLTLGHPILYHPTSYIGEWSYSFPFYSSELFIDKDGTFKFHEQGCSGHGYSEGKWTNYGTGILLTSFEKYSTNVPPQIIEIKYQTKSSNRENGKQTNKAEFILDSSIFNTTTTYGFSPSDTSNIYFDNVQMRLEGDILYRLDKNGFKAEWQFILTKNNR